MPASVILPAIFGNMFMAAAALGATGLAVATFAINFAASYIITRVFGQQASKQQDSGVRQQVPPSSTNAIPVVYGEAWMGGTFVDAVLTIDQQAMYYVMAISNISPGDPANGVSAGQFTYDTTKFYYGDRLIAFDGTDPTKVVSLTDGAGNVDTKVSGNLYINLYTSTTAGVITNVTGTAPSTFMGGADIAAGLRWTGTRQMNGLAFAIIKLIYNRDAGTTSLQPVTFKVKHALNGTGLAKPGDVLYDYLIQPYGGAVTASNVNATSCAALNTYSDATISYTPSGGGSATQARYRINGVVDTGRSVLDNVDKILVSCDSWLAYQASTGQWSPVINKAESTGFAFNDSNIIGDIKVSVVDLASSINQIEVSFPFKGNKDQPEYVFLQTPSGLLYPNEPVNKYTTSFDLVNDSVQASYLANRILEQAREDLIVSFSTAYTGIQVDAGDVISVTNTDYGWSAKLFRVTKVQEASLPDGNLGARIECAEYNSAVYDDASITQFAPIANSGLTSGYYFPSLSAPTFSDQQNGNIPPTFSVTCQLPSSSRATTVTLYYTTSISPSQSDWKVWAIQSAGLGEAFAASLALKFPNVIVGSDTYYFAFSIGNEVGTSDLSATSSSFNWATVIAGGQTAYNTGTGFFIGYESTSYKFSVGSSTQSLLWNGTSLVVTGNIYANGAGEFTGNTSTAFALTTALKANSTGTADIGVLGQSKTTGVSFGVYGYTNSSGASIGVQGVSTTASAIGVVAKNTSTGTALSVEGPMTMTNTTLVTNLNADQLDGKHASAFVEIASGTTNEKYLYYVNNNTAPTDPNNRAAWIKVSTNDGSVVWFPGYV